MSDHLSLDSGLVGLGDGDLAIGSESINFDEALADPLASVVYTDVIEDDMAAELDAVQKAFKDRRAAEAARFRAATDSEYWSCLCFQTREQRDAFLRAMKWADLGSKYLDGQEVAKRAGVALPVGVVPFVKEKHDRRLNALALPLQEK